MIQVKWTCAQNDVSLKLSCSFSEMFSCNASIGSRQKYAIKILQLPFCFIGYLNNMRPASTAMIYTLYRLRSIWLGNIFNMVSVVIIDLYSCAQAHIHTHTFAFAMAFACVHLKWKYHSKYAFACIRMWKPQASPECW